MTGFLLFLDYFSQFSAKTTATTQSQHGIVSAVVELVLWSGLEASRLVLIVPHRSFSAAVGAMAALLPFERADPLVCSCC